MNKFRIQRYFNLSPMHVTPLEYLTPEQFPEKICSEIGRTCFHISHATSTSKSFYTQTKQPMSYKNFINQIFKT